MTRDIWVYSDPHFGHENIIQYCGRPFANAEFMNEVLIDNHNSVVKDGDIVYCLGDVYFGTAGKVLDKLKGRKRLILGNHDNGKDQYLQRHFQKIGIWRMWPEFGLLFTHVPVHPNSLVRAEGTKPEIQLKNVHGHIHNNIVETVTQTPGGRFVHKPDERYANVSVEQINYTPVHIEELRVK